VGEGGTAARDAQQDRGSVVARSRSWRAPLRSTASARWRLQLWRICGMVGMQSQHKPSFSSEDAFEPLFVGCKPSIQLTGRARMTPESREGSQQLVLGSVSVLRHRSFQRPLCRCAGAVVPSVAYGLVQ